MNAPQQTGHFSDGDDRSPRFRTAGDLTLDLFHRDGRVDDRWLGLSPREFALLWRLAEQPGERITPTAESEDAAAHIAALCHKLAAAGLAQLIGTAADGSHFLDAPPIVALSRIAEG